MKRKIGNMPRTNEATDTDPCFTLAGTSLKVIYPVKKSFSNGVERLKQPGWKGEILCFISRSMLLV
ncbi:MAG: hypothetical protein HY096_15095 [Nitrospinae bacterium]|nr:hypothetical protein [Nitrospinota bacterium]